MLATHGFAGEFDPVCVVNEAVQDGIGVSGIPDQIEPACHGDLAGDHGGAAPVTVFQDLEQMVAGMAVERLKPPYVDGSCLARDERMF